MIRLRSLRNSLTIALLFLTLSSFSQQKDVQAGKKGSKKAEVLYISVPSDSTLANYELWYEGVKITSGQLHNGIKDGPWRFTDIDGKIFFQGLYKNGKKNGAWKYYSDKKLLCTVFFKDDLRDSTWQSYYPNGKVLSIMHFRKDMKEGKQETFFDNGDIASSAMYSNDTLLNLTSYHNGNVVRAQLEYRNGHLYNVLALNDSAGRPLDAGNFKNGNGQLIWYRPDGSKTFKAEYKDGGYDGTADYYSRGKIVLTGTMKEGKAAGQWYGFDKDNYRFLYHDYKGKSYDAFDFINALFLIDETKMTKTEPLPQGGDVGLADFITKNIIYPSSTLRDGVSGVVIVNFFVDNVGTVRNASVVQGLSKGLDQGALDVVDIFPPWTPAFRNGFPINRFYQLPITFRGNPRQSAKASITRQAAGGGRIINIADPR